MNRIQEILESVWNEGASVAGGVYLDTDKSNRTVKQAEADIIQLFELVIPEKAPVTGEHDRYNVGWDDCVDHIKSTFNKIKEGL